MMQTNYGLWAILQGTVWNKKVKTFHKTASTRENLAE